MESPARQISKKLYTELKNSTTDIPNTFTQEHFHYIWEAVVRRPGLVVNLYRHTDKELFYVIALDTEKPSGFKLLTDADMTKLTTIRPD